MAMVGLPSFSDIFSWCGGWTQNRFSVEPRCSESKQLQFIVQFQQLSPSYRFHVSPKQFCGCHPVHEHKWAFVDTIIKALASYRHIFSELSWAVNFFFCWGVIINPCLMDNSENAKSQIRAPVISSVDIEVKPAKPNRATSESPKGWLLIGHTSNTVLHFQDWLRFFQLLPTGYIYIEIFFKQP